MYNNNNNNNNNLMVSIAHVSIQIIIHTSCAANLVCRFQLLLFVLLFCFSEHLAVITILY